MRRSTLFLNTSRPRCGQPRRIALALLVGLLVVSAVLLYIKLQQCHAAYRALQTNANADADADAESDAFHDISSMRRRLKMQVLRVR